MTTGLGEATGSPLDPSRKRLGQRCESLGRALLVLLGPQDDKEGALPAMQSRVS